MMSQIVEALHDDIELSNGQRIHVKIINPSANESVACISGFGCSHYNFDFLTKNFDSNFRYILIDNRGMGKSSAATEAYPLRALGLDAFEVMDKLGSEKFHLIGISMGGFISQLMALSAPEKISSLSLLCTTSGGADFIDLPLTTEQALRSFYELNLDIRVEMAIKATVHPTLMQRDPKLFKEIIELRKMHPANVEQVLLQKKAVDEFLSYSISLEKVQVPSLILSGSEDRFVDPKNSKILHSKIVNSKLNFIEQTDHLFFFEEHALVASYLNQFLKGNTHD